MQVECNACGARYTIADDKIPIQGARVRCRKCQSVFSIDKSAPPAPSALPLIPPTPQELGPAPPAAAPAPPAAPESFASPEAPSPPSFATPDVGPTQIERFATALASTPEPAVETQSESRAAAPELPPAPSFQAADAMPAHPVAPEFVAPTQAAASPDAPSPSVSPYSRSAGLPEGLPEAERLKHERARRLARVLASDIAIYNKEKRERGIKEGNLVAVLGYEIKKSWEVYKERVTPDLANSTPYFRDALNEMLSEGKKVF